MTEIFTIAAMCGHVQDVQDLCKTFCTPLYRNQCSKTFEIRAVESSFTLHFLRRGDELLRWGSDMSSDDPRRSDVPMSFLHLPLFSQLRCDDHDGCRAAKLLPDGRWEEPGIHNHRAHNSPLIDENTRCPFLRRSFACRNSS